MLENAEELSKQQVELDPIYMELEKQKLIDEMNGANIKKTEKKSSENNSQSRES